MFCKSRSLGPVSLLRGSADGWSVALRLNAIEHGGVGVIMILIVFSVIREVCLCFTINPHAV